VQLLPQIKKGVSDDQDVRSWGKKDDPAIKNPLISKRLSASPTIISLQLPNGAK
jgi:hypothetical protein